MPRLCKTKRGGERKEGGHIGWDMDVRFLGHYGLK